MSADRHHLTYIEALGMILRHIKGSSCDLIAYESEASYTLVRFLVSAYEGGIIKLDDLRANPGKVFAI